MGSISLSKGSRISLSKEAPGLKNVMVGLGWDPVASKEETPKKNGILGGLFRGGSTTTTKAPDIDCDAFAILLDNNRLRASDDTVFFGKLRHKSEAVWHTGDNLTGDGDGDDEQIMIRLENLPSNYNKIVVGVNIYSAKSRGQSFGNIENAFIRIVNVDNNQEVCKYVISDSPEYNSALAVIFGELVRADGGWEFNAIGTPSTAGSIQEIASKY